MHKYAGRCTFRDDCAVENSRVRTTVEHACFFMPFTVRAVYISPTLSSAIQPRALWQLSLSFSRYRRSAPRHLIFRTVRRYPKEDFFNLFFKLFKSIFFLKKRDGIRNSKIKNNFSFTISVFNRHLQLTVVESQHRRLCNIVYNIIWCNIYISENPPGFACGCYATASNRRGRRTCAAVCICMRTRARCDPQLMRLAVRRALCVFGLACRARFVLGTRTAEKKKNASRRDSSTLFSSRRCPRSWSRDRRRVRAIKIPNPGSSPRKEGRRTKGRKRRVSRSREKKTVAENPRWDAVHEIARSLCLFLSHFLSLFPCGHPDNESWGTKVDKGSPDRRASRRSMFVYAATEAPIAMRHHQA